MIFNVILLLIWCHIVAVGFYLFVKGDNLVRPMFTGKKPHRHVPAGLNLSFTRLYIALLFWSWRRYRGVDCQSRGHMKKLFSGTRWPCACDGVRGGPGPPPSPWTRNS